MHLKRYETPILSSAILSQGAGVAKLRHCVQDKRHQMMNDVRALCDAPHVPGLVDFVGAYHESENGQVQLVMPAGPCSPNLSI